MNRQELAAPNVCVVGDPFFLYLGRQCLNKVRSAVAPARAKARMRGAQELRDGRLRAGKPRKS